MALGNLKFENYEPYIKQNKGIRTAYDITTSGTLTAGALGQTAPLILTAANANALAVGANGSTNPVLKIDTATASVATGVSITGAAAAGGVAVAAISSGTDENLTINAKGSGTVTINGTATGGITLGRATTITTGNLTVTNGSIVVSANASQLSFTGTGANGGVLKNLKNAAASALSGTQLDIEILIGSTPYYFTVYPTKA